MTSANSPDFWEHVYQEMDAPWDLGGPTPVFQQLAEAKRFVPGRMIVLGAGKGHDARLFAEVGFAVTAVDFAETAVCHMHANNHPMNPFTPLQADIFALPHTLDGTFDYVLEYTCFCAIDKVRRDEYANLVQRLLRSGGTYIALAFPIVDRVGGPPFAVQPDDLIDLFTKRNFTLCSREVPTHSTKHRLGIEELLIMQKQ